MSLGNLRGASHPASKKSPTYPVWGKMDGNGGSKISLLKNLVKLSDSIEVKVYGKTFSVISYNPYIVLKFPLLDLPKVLSILPRHTLIVHASNSALYNSILSRLNNTTYSTWNIIQFAGRIYRITLFSSDLLHLTSMR